MIIYSDDETLQSLREKFSQIPFYISSMSKKVALENADYCAVIADRYEELDLMKEAREWRATEKAYRKLAEEAVNP